MSYNDVTSVSIRNRSISQCKSNKKPMSLQYRVHTGKKALLVKMMKVNVAISYSIVSTAVLLVIFTRYSKLSF